MDHAVAVKEVVAASGREEGVGAVPDVDPAEGGRDGADDVDVVPDWRLGDRSEIPGELYYGV